MDEMPPQYMLKLFTQRGRQPETTMRFIALLTFPWLLVGCISFSSESKAPDFAAACAGKEDLCKEICGSTGIQAYSCKAAPREGMDYRCECKRP